MLAGLLTPKGIAALPQTKGDFGLAKRASVSPQGGTFQGIHELLGVGIIRAVLCGILVKELLGCTWAAARLFMEVQWGLWAGFDMIALRLTS